MSAQPTLLEVLVGSMQVAATEGGVFPKVILEQVIGRIDNVETVIQEMIDEVKVMEAVVNDPNELLPAVERVLAGQGPELLKKEYIKGLLLLVLHGKSSLEPMAHFREQLEAALAETRAAPKPNRE